MVFRDIGLDTPGMTFNLLNEAIYLEPDEVSTNPITIPILSLDENAHLVDYDHLKQLVLEDGVYDFEDAKQILAEMNDITLESIVTAIPEYEVILNPSITEAVGSYVITPISTNSDVYEFCEAAVSLYEETGNERYLEYLLLEEVPRELITAIAMDKSLKPWEKQDAINSLFRKDRKVEAEKKAKAAAANPPAPAKKKEPSAMGSVMKQAMAITQAKADKAAQERAAKSGGGDSNNNSTSLFGKLKQHAGAAKDEMKAFGKDLKSGAQKEGIGGKVSGIKDAITGHKKAAGATAAVAIAGTAIGAGIYQRLKRLRAQAENEPKTWLAKKIASLRSIYQNYLQKARIAKSQGQASVFQKVASAILGCIDFLMKKMQNAVG